MTWKSIARNSLNIHSFNNSLTPLPSLENGAMTTLGRDGSDFSASIFGKLLEASEVLKVL